MQGVRGGVNVSAPEGWSQTAFFGRLVIEGLCRYESLKDGTLTLDDVFEMHRMLDLKIYHELKAQEKAQQNVRRR